MIRSIFYYAHGVCSALRDTGDQDTVESEPWFLAYLRPLVAAGVVDSRTMVKIPGTHSGPMQSLRNGDNLPPDVPFRPGMDRLIAIAFNPNGTTVCVGADNGRCYRYEQRWYIPSIKDKIKRGVVDADTKIRVPGAFFGTVADLPKDQID